MLLVSLQKTMFKSEISCLILVCVMPSRKFNLSFLFEIFIFLSVAYAPCISLKRFILCVGPVFDYIAVRFEYHQRSNERSETHINSKMMTTGGDRRSAGLLPHEFIDTRPAHIKVMPASETRFSTCRCNPSSWSCSSLSVTASEGHTSPSPGMPPGPWSAGGQ
jgi:hypothetical protein